MRFWLDFREAKLFLRTDLADITLIDKVKMIDHFFIKYNQKQWAVLELTARDFIINGAFLPPRGSAMSFSVGNFWITQDKSRNNQKT